MRDPNQFACAKPYFVTRKDQHSNFERGTRRQFSHGLRGVLDGCYLALTLCTAVTACLAGRRLTQSVRIVAGPANSTKCCMCSTERVLRLSVECAGAQGRDKRRARQVWRA